MSDNQLPVPAQTKEVRQWAMLCHFAAFLGLVFPFGSVLGPLILWQVKKDMDPLIDDQGKEALNFQLTVAIAWLVCFVLGFVIIGFLMMAVLVIAACPFLSYERTLPILWVATFSGVAMMIFSVLAILSHAPTWCPWANL